MQWFHIAHCLCAGDSSIPTSFQTMMNSSLKIVSGSWMLVAELASQGGLGYNPVTIARKPSELLDAQINIDK